MSDTAVLEQVPTAYETLGAHPTAPAELISACYWAMVRDLQEKRGMEREAGAALHRLTRAYESVSDPVRRAGYNLSINSTVEPLTKRPLPRRRSSLMRLFRRNHHALKWSVGPHEVLGLHPRAPQAVVPIAYRLVRDSYMRLPPGSRRQETLLNLLDESYEILSDPQRRAQLAEVGQAEEQEFPGPTPDDPPVSDRREPSPPHTAEVKVAPPLTDPSPREPLGTQLRVPDGPVAAVAGPEDAPARDASPVSDLRESPQSDMAEAQAEPHITEPALEQLPGPTDTQLRVPDETVAAGAGPEDASAQDDQMVIDRQGPSQPETPEPEAAPTITDPAPRETPRTQRGVPDGPVAAGAGREDGGAGRRAASAIVALAAATMGTVARGVRWATLAVAALTVVVARFVGRSVRSGWLATREWLDRSWAERRKTKETRSREASGSLVSPDEAFLGRLAATVEMSKTKRGGSNDEAKSR